MENAVNSLRVNCVDGITANAERTRDMVLNSLGIVTVLKPSLGYKQCAEIAREGYQTGKSLHDLVVKEKKLLTQEHWDEVFSFENLINPEVRTPPRRPPKRFSRSFSTVVHQGGVSHG
jgi:aspartate ammonia-lyase